MNTPAHLQPFSRFMEKVFAIQVTPTMDRGRLRMLPSNQAAEDVMSRLGDDLVAMAPQDIGNAAKSQWVTERLDRLFDQSFSDDLWYGEIPGAGTVILVKDTVIQAHSLEKVMRRVHATEVLEAARAGAALPSDVAAEYQIELQSLRHSAQSAS